MAALPKYQFVIKDQSGNLYEFENATHRAYSVYENGVGRCRFFIPKNDLKLTTSSVSDTAFSEIRVYRDGTLVWQGMTQIIQDTVDGTFVYGETFNTALGWYSVRFQQTYSVQNLNTIITNEYNNIVGRTNNFLSAKITLGTIESPFTTATAVALTITRTLYSENFLDFLKQMTYVGRAELTSSFSQYTVFNISFSETTPTFSFLRNVGTTKSDVVFELGSEIKSFNNPRDFRFIENSDKGYAVSAAGVALTSTKTDATSQTSFYLREGYPYYNNITGQTDLDKRTNNRVIDRKDPARAMFIQYAAGLKPFDGYSLGDFITLRIDTGRLDSSESRRVVGMEVSIDRTGVENTIPVLQKPAV